MLIDLVVYQQVSLSGMGTMTIINARVCKFCYSKETSEKGDDMHAGIISITLGASQLNHWHVLRSHAERINAWFYSVRPAL